MGIFGNAWKAAQDKANDSAYWSRFTNKNFAEAVAAICARVAVAGDGQVSPAEEAKLDRYLQIAPELAHFDKSEVKGMFKRFVAMVEFTPQKVDAEIKQVKPEQRQDVWDIGYRIAAADGDVSKEEEAVLREIAGYLGLDVSGRFTAS
jgi:tellurite resistance protein